MYSLCLKALVFFVCTANLIAVAMVALTLSAALTIISVTLAKTWLSGKNANLPKHSPTTLLTPSSLLSELSNNKLVSQKKKRNLFFL